MPLQAWIDWVYPGTASKRIRGDGRPDWPRKRRKSVIEAGMCRHGGMLFYIGSFRVAVEPAWLMLQ